MATALNNGIDKANGLSVELSPNDRIEHNYNPCFVAINFNNTIYAQFLIKPRGFFD